MITKRNEHFRNLPSNLDGDFVPTSDGQVQYILKTKHCPRLSLSSCYDLITNVDNFKHAHTLDLTDCRSLRGKNISARSFQLFKFS